MTNAPEQTVTSANFVIAVGARARSLPGTTIDGQRVIEYRDALVLSSAAPRS